MPGVINKHSPEHTESLSPFWHTSLDESAISTAWSSDGALLAAASASGSIYVVDVPNQWRVQKWLGHQFGATAVVWHPQDALLASAGQDGKVRFWRANEHRSVKVLDCGDEWVEHVAWSSSGRYLATAAGRKLKLWNKDGELVRTYPDHPHTIAAIAWKTDSDELVSACYGLLQFWRQEAERPHQTFSWKGSMLSLAWSPDGRYLCHGNQDATVHFWIVRFGKELQMWGYPTKVRELAWDRRSRYLATGGGSSITVWDCSGKGPAHTKPTVLHHHRVPVTRLAYQRSGSTLASGCGQGMLALWKPSKRESPDAIGFLKGSITDMAWSPGDSFLAVTAEDGSLAVYSCP